MKAESRSPSREEWKALFDAARLFAKMKPWGWMGERDLFGVQNPEDGEIAYCSVSGAAGDAFGLSAYLGSQGLSNRKTGEDTLHARKALTVTFEGKRHLDERDLQVIADLKLKFKGRNSWPQFRSYLPGYVPWYLDAEQSRFLETVLEQSLDVAKRVRENSELLREGSNTLVLVRVQEKGKKTVLWKDAWIEPEPWENPGAPSAPIDEARLRWIARQLKKGQGAWEIDSFYYPGAMDEGGRPYYPVLSLIVERPDDVVVGSWMSTPWERYSGFQEQVVNHLANSSELPRTIRVRSGEILELLAPIARCLKISLEQVDSLEGIGGVRAALV